MGSGEVIEKKGPPFTNDELYEHVVKTFNDFRWGNRSDPSLSPEEADIHAVSESCTPMLYAPYTNPNPRPVFEKVLGFWNTVAPEACQQEIKQYANDIENGSPLISGAKMIVEVARDLKIYPKQS